MLDLLRSHGHGVPEERTSAQSLEISREKLPCSIENGVPGVPCWRRTICRAMEALSESTPS